MNGVSLDLKNGTATVKVGLTIRTLRLRYVSRRLPSGSRTFQGFRCSAASSPSCWRTDVGDGLLSTDAVMANASMLKVNSRMKICSGAVRTFASFTFKLRMGNITKFNIVWPPGKQVELLEGLTKVAGRQPQGYLNTRNKSKTPEPWSIPARSSLLDLKRCGPVLEPNRPHCAS